MAITKKNKAAAGKIVEREFLYRDVASRLRERITSGKYPPNSKLPSLYDLVDEFEVSAISVRRALRELNYEGLIYGEQGRGVFVKAKAVIHRVLAADADRSIGDEIARAGFAPKIKGLRHDQIKADEDIAQRLGLKPGTKIHRHQKMAYADAEPVSLHFLYFPDLIADRLKENLGRAFVFRLLERAKIKVERLKFEFGAAALAAAHSEIFRLPAGFPMGLIYFTPMAKGNKPILTGLTIYRSDRFVFEINVPL
jgi:GntR family transcriptional regulator